MNLRNKISIIILIALLISCLLYINLSKKHPRNDDPYGSLKKEYATIQNEINNLSIKDCKMIGENNDTVLISSLITKRKKLIFRFSELNCDSCVMVELENLKTKIKNNKLDINDLVLITFYRNPRHLLLFKRINELTNFKIYNTINDSLGINKLDNLSVPVFFVLNSELNIENTFIPIKQINQRTINYLNSITDDFSK